MTGPVPKIAELGFRSSGETEQTEIQTTYKWSPLSPCRDGGVGSKEVFGRKDLVWREGNRPRIKKTGRSVMR